MRARYLPAAGKPIAFTPLTEQPLGEIESFLHLAQLASHFTDLVTKDRDLSLTSLVQHARVHPRLLQPQPGDLEESVENDCREGDGQCNDRNEQRNDLLIHGDSSGRRAAHETTKRRRGAPRMEP